MIGKTLGSYEILDALGKGGMGEVYRARDTRLGREVAIKVLPREMSGDPERVARFDREARLLASLQHANIASIYSFEHEDQIQFLAMELVEGQTLEDRLRAGPLPHDEVLRVAGQVAVGLEAAHEKGIVHRDLKPANVMLTREGEVKILDFGLARAWFGERADDEDLSNSPTITAAMTQAGMVLGTAAYMSPEQAHGRAVDRRADIWSFGCVLFELFTAKPLFLGESVSDTLAGVLRSEPDFDALPDDVPAGIRKLLVRCLTKEPRQRLQSIGEARIVLEAHAAGVVEEPDLPGPQAMASPSEKSGRRMIAPVALAVALFTVAGIAIGRFSAPVVEHQSEPAVAHLELPLPSIRPVATGSFLNPLAISPDGRTLVYVGVEDGVRRLYQRPLDQLMAEPVPGTEGAEGPFFSPDGEEVAFWAEGRVQRVSLAGGLPRPIFTSTDFRGAVWLPDGSIIASPSQNGPLHRVPAAGGEFTPVTIGGPGLQHRLPSLLPDGRILFGIRTGDRFAYDNSGLAVLSLETGEMRAVADGVGIDGRYAAGHLFYVQASNLIARPFDLDSLEFTGPPRTIQQGVQVQTNTGAAQFALTPDGSLAFVPGEAIGDDVALARVERDGSSTYLSNERDTFRWPILTADRSQLTVLIISEERSGRWATRLDKPGLTHMPVSNAWVAWAPDGRHAAIRSGLDADADSMVVHYVDMSGSSEQTRLFAVSSDVIDMVPTSFSPDGGSVLIGVAVAMDQHDVYAVDVGDPSSARPFLDSEAIEFGACFSPDGRWVAYVSNTSGRFEIHLTDWPEKRLDRRISTNGGREPRWSPAGDELFYRSGERMMAVRLGLDGSLEVDTPEILFTGDYEGVLGVPDYPNYEVDADGSFLMLRSEDLSSTADRISFVRDAIDALGARPETSGR